MCRFSVHQCVAKVYYKGATDDLFQVERAGRSVFMAPNGRFLAWIPLWNSWGVVASLSGNGLYAQNKVFT